MNVDPGSIGDVVAEVGDCPGVWEGDGKGGAGGWLDCKSKVDVEGLGR